MHTIPSRITLVLLFFLRAATHGAGPVSADPLADVNTLRTFPTVDLKEDWQGRAREIREQVLLSCGLWPGSARPPIEAKIFGKVERDGYSIEKVYFATRPGFFLAGNLYRPLGRGPGPFPAILNPHGHWTTGRFVDTKEGSIAARCINFARQGMIAFSYDMVGYNDTHFREEPGAGPAPEAYKLHRRFATAPVNQLWNISLMGLQTWNSLRALDFLAVLPDVDPRRLACTGESGGGTQTFMLGAIDDRLAVQAPIVMVSHTMQGGCSCENAPGLRVQYSNMEIAASAAPRPQILVGATGDWTKKTLTVEGPALEHIYQLLGAGENLRYAVFDFPHNYNQTSREAVYEFFGRWLKPAAPAVSESAYTKEPDRDLRVFEGETLPPEAMTEAQVIAALVSERTKTLAVWQPRDEASLERFKKEFLPAFHHTVQVGNAHAALQVDSKETKTNGNVLATEIVLGRAGSARKIPAWKFAPLAGVPGRIAILAHPKGRGAYLHAGAPNGLAKTLVDRGMTVLILDLFGTGEGADDQMLKARDPFINFFTTYNRTDLQERVFDLALACEYVHTRNAQPRAILCGSGRAGLWVLAAAPFADAVVADCDDFDSGDDRQWLAQDVFTPGFRVIGGWEGAAALAAPHPLFLHNTGKFSTGFLRAGYVGSAAFKLSKAKVLDDVVGKWVEGVR